MERSVRRRGLTCVEVGLIVVLFALAATLLLPAGTRSREVSNRTKCGNNLRQLGLAAVQYSDDLRFFPHVRGLRERDGDLDTSDTPKKLRLLFHRGYFDVPEGLICPSSIDMVEPLAPQARTDLRRWFWGGGAAPEAPGPLQDGLEDPTLRATTELSYGWTRAAMTLNARSDRLLAADRSLRPAEEQPWDESDAIDFGNHQGYGNVLRADASVDALGVAAGPEGEPVAPADPDLDVHYPPGWRFTASWRTPPRPLVKPTAALGLATLCFACGWVALAAWRRWTLLDQEDPLVVRRRPPRSRWRTAQVALPGSAAPPPGAPAPTPIQPGQRCPWCHAPVGPGDDAVACQACRTLTHRECALEHGRCTTLGCVNVTRPGPGGGPPPPRDAGDAP